MNTTLTVDAILTLRDDNIDRGEGTQIARTVRIVHPPGFAVEAKDYVILVHGYNVSYARGRESYARFRWWLEHYETKAHILEFHWPGDLNQKWGRRASIASYPFKIQTARHCGRRLGIWIMRQPPGVRFTLVGHSLGCRVVTEAVRLLQRHNGMQRLSKVCLMAAAIPVRHIETGRLGPRTGDDKHWRILYSREDEALGWAFTSGQTVGGDARFGRAVGYYGEPLEIWKQHGMALEMYQARPAEQGERFYRHGDYWQAGPTESENEEQRYWKFPMRPIPADLSQNFGASAESVAALLGAQIARHLPIRPMAPYRPLPTRILDAINPFDAK